MHGRARREPSRAGGVPPGPRSGVAARRGTVGDEAAETSAVARDDTVERVDGRRKAEAVERHAQVVGDVQLAQERDAAAAVAAEQRPVAEDEPPALAALLRPDSEEQRRGLGVRERQQRELVAPVERGGDPRRPAAEPSAAVVEQNRTPGLHGCRVAHEARRDYDRA